MRGDLAVRVVFRSGGARALGEQRERASWTYTRTAISKNCLQRAVRVLSTAERVFRVSE